MFATEAGGKWEVMIELLQAIENELKVLNTSLINRSLTKEKDFLHVPFKGAEIYLLHKAFVDAGGAPQENYKSLLETPVASLANKTQRGFSASSFCRYSDKVDLESKENTKRFLMRMIRNIDSYD